MQAKRPCNNFFAQGSCRFGDKCHFSHDLEEVESMMANPDVQEQMAQMIEQAQSFDKGKKEAGPQANGASKLCHFFAQGRCNKGAQCPFSHGD